ncbi:hypothetical protein HD553DRAFT_341767 [Filobasidium floriforme]|uniref:uncharacterized protein n=1 Tax=Filobasidium floriforme TaxID=5210 RepID=UPI001E8E14A5|nr:uncharacterized protein HD553DRAFT_341767 [Filobasidium floriforme]KAH8085156.1 hypothetical protein HD553DRAFT_341767 [Filobasidium floriforme]
MPTVTFPQSRDLITPRPGRSAARPYRKKAKGNVYLTPGEMEVLTQRWAPYRSLGVYYMWAVAEETGG